MKPARHPSVRRIVVNALAITPAAPLEVTGHDSTGFATPAWNTSRDTEKYTMAKLLEYLVHPQLLCRLSSGSARLQALSICPATPGKRID